MFFQLLLHEVFLRLGATLDAHPCLENTSKRPDFWIRFSRDEQFLLEATLFCPREDSDKPNAWGAVFDAINSKPFPCYIHVVSVDAPKGHQPSPRKILRFLEENLAGSGTTGALDVSGERELRYFDGRADIRFSMSPKSNPDPKPQSIGMYPCQVRSGGSEKSLRDDLHEKANRYGKTGHPFVIAINSQSLWTRETSDIEMALVGTRQEYISHSDGRLRVRNLEDGFWGAAGKEKNTRVSAVLYTNVNPFRIGGANFVLYVNNRATPRLQLSSWPFELVRCTHEVAERRPASTTLTSVLEIPEDWPGQLYD